MRNPKNRQTNNSPPSPKTPLGATWWAILLLLTSSLAASVWATIVFWSVLVSHRLAGVAVVGLIFWTLAVPAIPISLKGDFPQGAPATRLIRASLAYIIKILAVVTLFLGGAWLILLAAGSLSVLGWSPGIIGFIYVLLFLQWVRLFIWGLGRFFSRANPPDDHPCHRSQPVQPQ